MRFLYQRGFTLIELIIVLIVIAGGIWLYSALFGGGDDEDEMEKKVSTQQASTIVFKGGKMRHARYIATDDKKWNAPLLYEISEIIRLEDDILSYQKYHITADILLFMTVNSVYYSDKFSHYYQLTCIISSSSGSKNFFQAINDQIILKLHSNHKTYTEKFTKAITNICDVEKRACDGFSLCGAYNAYFNYTFVNDLIARKWKVYYNTNVDFFDNNIFNTIIADADMTNSGFGLWLYNVGQHEPLFKAVKLLLEQYHDLANRLTVLHEGRAKIINEYGEGSDVKALDSDIKKLSALGWQLTQVTKRFFVAIKPRMVKLEVAATRQQALAGLRTFENEIDAAQMTSSQSLDDIIANIDQAVRKLERAINQ